MTRTLERLVPRDPRDAQILALTSFLVLGTSRLGFGLGASQVACTLLGAQFAQWACTRLTRGAPGSPFLGLALPWEPRSALISSLSLCLLLRTDVPAVAAVAAALAIAGKFAIRVRGKHVFNPVNGALALLLAIRAPVWVSPGQWGQTALVALLVAGLGFVVTTRAARRDVSFAFLAAWAALLFGRAAWLGQPWSTPLHQLSNGALLLFAFFMISDPRTTPDSRAGRIVFAMLVALGAFAVQFGLWRTNGLLWSLAIASFAVPAIDAWLPGARHAWPAWAAPAREAPVSAPGSRGHAGAPA